ncbi:hypothetical protein HO151_00780, partial [Streptomyces sp. 8P21H-1]|nr:hypothetical protein [Streptomyces sp. 8P21H-1]
GQAWDRPWGPRPDPQAPQGTGQDWAPADEWDGARQDQDAQISSWSASPQGAGGPGAQAQGWDGSAQGQGVQGVQGQTPQYQDPSGRYRTQGAEDRWGAQQTPGGAIPQAPQAPQPHQAHQAHADEGATQFLPPVAAAPSADEGATQLLPPVG